MFLELLPLPAMALSGLRRKRIKNLADLEVFRPKKFTGIAFMISGMNWRSRVMSMGCWHSLRMTKFSRVPLVSAILVNVSDCVVNG